jgi:hypothetical protein
VRLSYPVLALTLGLLGAIAIELSSTLLGLVTALTSWAVVDALIYSAMTLLLALAFAPLFRRTRGFGLLGVGLLFLLVYAPLTGVVAGLAELTLAGGWGSASLVRGALVIAPVNLIYALAVELWFVAVPLGVATVLLLWWHSRSQVGLRRSA